MTHKPNLWSRRAFLKLGAAGAVALPFWRTLLGGPAAAMNGRARRLIIFYFPDGCAGMSQDGQPSQWHAQGSELGFSLPNQLQPLERLRQHCVFLNGLSMGGTDSGSHPGGAKKLLHRRGRRQRRVDRPVPVATRSGANSLRGGTCTWASMANQNNASGDKHIVYPSAGQTIPPEDDPLPRVRAPLRRKASRRACGNTDGGGPSADREHPCDGDAGKRACTGRCATSTSWRGWRRARQARAAPRGSARSRAPRGHHAAAPGHAASGQLWYAACVFVLGQPALAVRSEPLPHRPAPAARPDGAGHGVRPHARGHGPVLASHQRADHEPLPGHGDVGPGLRHAQPPGLALRPAPRRGAARVPRLPVRSAAGS
jgi:hypothetical protein